MDAAQDRTTRLARLKLVGELLKLKASIVAMPETDKLGRLRAVRRVLEIRRELGAGAIAAQPPAEASAAATDDEDRQYETVGEARNPAAAFYDFNPNRKPSQRKRENAAAIDLLRQVRAGDVNGTALTGEQKAVLARYSGTGGNLVGEDGAQGSAYEYYTPKPIAEGAWELLRDMGFSGGKVLDPCAGVGIFGGTAPASAVVDAVELNATSGEINGLVNQGPGYSCKVSNFERVAAATPDGIYDAVISNVPFGNTADRGSNYRDDPKYQDETLEGYFILRSLEKLKPGGLAAFICPPRCVSGKGGKEESVRLRASLLAEFMGAYRLPSTLFLSAGAETVTDLLVFRKHGADALETIQDLADTEPAKLREAMVVWPGFIDGGYFAGEGARYVLGEFKAKDPTKFRDVDRVISDKGPVEIAKLLKKFGGSRIDWAMLKADPAVPIVYRDGDTVTQGGQMLQMRDGAWVPIERQGDSPRAADLGNKLATPMHAFKANLPLGEIAEWVVYMHAMSKSDEVPPWLRETLASITRLLPSDRARYWPVAITSLCVADVLDRHGRDSEPIRYATEYADLSEAMQRHAADAGTLPTAAGSAIRDAAARLRIHYTRKGGFSAVWRGDVVTERADGRTLGQRFEAVKYAEGGTWVTREQAAEVYGADFDPIADAAWCISPDGRKVCKADDFYTGNYGDMLADLKAQAAAATDDTVRGKLLAMQQEAHARVQRVDASKVSFNLASPFVTIEEKAEFLRRYYGPGFSVNYESGEGQIDYEAPGNASRFDEEKHKLLRRMAYYVRNGTVTLQGSKFKDDRKALASLRKMAREANEQFGAYCRANPTITRRLEEQANDPAKMHFPQTRNTDPVPLPGWKMGTPPDGVTPHGYQYAEIRRRGHYFGGINGYGVGLGKTMTALACVQHVHAIGVKKRTAFVVPNSVLSNWKKEATVALADMDQCLFVGLGVDKKGNAKMDPSAYDADLSRIAEGRHAKIFMTFEAFRRLRLRDETLDRYLDSMGEVDSSMAIGTTDDGHVKKKDIEKVESRGNRLADAITKGHSSSAPFLEDLGIDSIVLDEGHVAKNSAKLRDFKGAKFLSIADPSGVGMDMQAKAAFIRGLSPKKDGVLVLTATPITNSPAEVYAMLSLAVGADRVNDMAMGVKGPDEFMNLVCEVESEEDETIDGILRDTRVFKGLTNVDVLRRAIAEVITIETPETVGMTIQLPDADARATPVAMPDPPMIERLKLYKSAYRFAVDKLAGKGENEPANRGSKDAYDLVARRFNEPIDLIGHPFNMIRKMTAAIMDPELDDIATFYTVPAGGEEKAAALVAQFNALKIDEERARPGPRTLPAAVVNEKTKKVDGDKVSVLVVRVAAVIEGNRIVIDSIDPDTIAKFEKLEEKAGLDLDVSVPPKLAAMLDNFRKEEMTPRGVDDEGKPSPVVKQIVFCDILAMHAKIKRLLRKQAGVSGGAIAIITGRTNNKPEDILAVQDGFNAHGTANKYRVAIANEKAEVGINLQRGTQAIHHLTIGWTPDSLTQRDGRGVRQGNNTERVTVYSYDADGTFDQHKRGMVNKKADWIDNVMDIHGSGSIQIDGGLTREQEEALIETVGDADAMNRFTENLAAKERDARQAGVREKQAIAVKTIKANQKFLEENNSVTVWAGKKLASFTALMEQAQKLSYAVSDAKSPAKRASAEAALVDLHARMAGLEREINGAFNVGEFGVASVRAMAQKALQRGGKGGPSKWDFENQFLNAVTRKVVAPIEGSALLSDYEFERSQAEAMIKAGREQFASYSDRDGGIPAEVVDAIIAGDGAMIGDVPVVRGTILVRNGMLYVAKNGKQASAWQNYRHGPEQDTAEIGQLIPCDEVHYPGGASYPAAADRAAKIEDDALGGIPPQESQRPNLFATLSPMIASRRKSADLVEIDRRRLPAPYFPFVISEQSAGTDLVLLAIRRDQQAIVKTVGGRDYVGSTVQLLPYSATAFPLKSLREWCAARGERVTIQGANRMISFSAVRFPEVLGWFLPQVDSMLSFEREVEGNTEATIRLAARDWLVRNAPQLDLGTLTLDAVLPPHLSGIVQTKIKALTPPPAAAPAPAPAVAPPPAAAKAPAPAPDAVNVSALKDTDMVGIRGDTKPVKEFIKAVANELGGYKWAKNAEQWNVQFRAWKAIIERRPDLAKTLEMTQYRPR